MTEPIFKDVVCIVLANIPAGQVISYSELAQQAGKPRAARFVARILKQLPADTKLPWHRVVNAQGKISLPLDSPSGITQRERLELEGWTVINGRLIESQSDS